MANREGGIYYRNYSDFDFDKACAFLVQEGISLLNKPKNGKILALDDIGDEYEISYEQTKQKALSGNIFNVIIWLNYQRQSYWTFRSENNCLIIDFYLGFLFQEERNQVSKTFTKFFLSEISEYPQSLLGMYIDKNGETYDYSFDPVFLTDSEEVDYITDLICLPQEKFGLVVMEPGFAMKELNNGIVCASRYREFLDYLLS